MATTAQAILEGAYNRSSSNDAGKLAGDPELLAHLDRVYQRAWAQIARGRPDQFGALTTLTLLGQPPRATLPADLIDVLQVATADGATVSLIPATERTRLWHLAPCVYRIGATLTSRNQGGDPVSGAVLTATVLDPPAALTALAATLDARWPARHVQFLVDALAIYLSTKDAGRDAGEHKKLLDEARVAAAALAAEFGLPPSALEWQHAPAERAGAGGVA
jgi:hypothetical protein